MVEFTIVLPLLLLLIFGILEFGRAINYWIDANHLANVAARFAVVDNNPGADDSKSLQQWVLEQGDTDELIDAAEVCIDFPGGTAEVGDPVRAVVTVDFNMLPYLASELGVGSTTMKGSAIMRLEQEPSEYAAECA